MSEDLLVVTANLYPLGEKVYASIKRLLQQDFQLSSNQAVTDEVADTISL
jgi:hypothetical protein